MEVNSLETEAKNTALKHISTIFQRPDQLQRVEQYKKRTSRKKASVEAMLKSGVSSQLEGVKHGLLQLEEAVNDVKAIHANLKSIEQSYVDMAPLKEKLRRLKDESVKHAQYATAMENLHSIFHVPQTIEKTREFITDGKMLHAHKNLMELEAARDELLIEIHHQNMENKHEARLLEAYFSEIKEVNDELAKHLWYILRRTLDTARNEPAKVATVMRIVMRETRIDQFYHEREKQFGFLPPQRLKNWKSKSLGILEDVVRERIEGVQIDHDRTANKTWLVCYLELCRQRILEDLRIIQTQCAPCFPPSWNMIHFFFTTYHNVMSSRLKEIANDSMEKNEIIQLLSWLKNYTSPELLGSPLLQIPNMEEYVLENPLLPKSVINALISKFVEVTRKDLSEWLDKALSKEKDDWYNGAEPESDSEGCFYSSLPSILYGMIDDQIRLSQEIGDDAILRTLDVCFDQFIIFSEKYKEAAEAFKLKHFEDRTRFAKFTHVTIAVANNCYICSEAERPETETTKSRVKKIGSGDVRKVGSGDIASLRITVVHKIDQLKDQWNLNVQACVFNLLEEVFMDLGPHMVEIFTRKWLGNRGLVDTICATIDDYYQDHKHLKPNLLLTLIPIMQHRILYEYCRAVETRRLTFSTYEDRYAAGSQLSDESKIFRSMLEKLAEPTKDEVEILTDVLNGMGEILMLRDKSLLALEVSSFVQKFHDVTAEQLSGLISLREDVGRSESRQLAQEILSQNRFRTKQNSPFLPVFQPSNLPGLVKTSGMAQMMKNALTASQPQQQPPSEEP